MKITKRIAMLGIVIMCLYSLGELGICSYCQIPAPKEAAPAPEAADVMEESMADTVKAPPADSPPLPEPLMERMETCWDEEILETCIQGGLSIKNATDYEVDMGALLSAGPDIHLAAEGPQILIIHTHSSEAYTQAGLDHYEESDDHRTQNKAYSIIRVGDELTEIFEQAGLRVIHDRQVYDYPSYTGCYSRSGAAVEDYLREYPDIAVVLDVHRDALGADGVVYKTMAEEDGSCASQIMLLSGSDASGLEHPDWKSNLSLALYLQNAVSSRHPTLMRPVSLVRERYNQHLSRGSLIIEVGSSGNTLQEALAAIRLFAHSAAPALKALER